MNLTSFLANKCIEYLLKSDSGQEGTNPHAFHSQKSAGQNSSPVTLLPPWSLDVNFFRKICDGCGECLAHCENKILELNKDGYPGVNFFKGSCSFCGACAQNCPKGALRFTRDSPPWNLRAAINRNCLMNNRVLCNTCLSQCHKEAIIFPQATCKGQAPEILAARCVGCGACFRSCPAGAISFINKNMQVQS